MGEGFQPRPEDLTIVNSTTEEKSSMVPNVSITDPTGMGKTEIAKAVYKDNSTKNPDVDAPSISVTDPTGMGKTEIAERLAKDNS